MAKYYDTLLAEYVKNPGIRWLSLDAICVRDFEYGMISYDEITSKKKINFVDVALNDAAIYSGEDVYMTAQLYAWQKTYWDTKNTWILDNMEQPLIDIIATMELDGVKIHRDKLKEIGIKLENEIAILEKNIHHIADEVFNINSPKQVGEILFEKLGLPKWKKTKTGYSVSAEVLNELATQYEIASQITLYRHYSKLKSTYIEWICELLDEDDFVHTSYNQAVTTTGRLSSTAPNLQNIPTGSGVAGEIREAFISRWDWWTMMALDYSQVEVRILALMSWDENLLDIFKNGEDMHAKTAKFIGTNERRIAKAVNFGVIYGISAFWLSKNINIPIVDAKKYIDGFNASYPKIAAFFEDIVGQATQKWYAQTVYGRRRYLPGLSDKNAIMKKAAQREAMNMPIQWTSADIIKLAMIEVAAFLDKKELKTKMIMQVHDELVFDVYPGEEEVIETEVKIIMENIFSDKTIPLKVDVGQGATWKEAK